MKILKEEFKIKIWRKKILILLVFKKERGKELRRQFQLVLMFKILNLIWTKELKNKKNLKKNKNR